MALGRRTDDMCSRRTFVNAAAGILAGATLSRGLGGDAQAQDADTAGAPLYPSEMKWWQKTIFYELYPKSFQDTRGQGTGTLRGVIERLDHLASLGVGAIWLTPVCVSPMGDNGYDVADYYDIDPSFGTMADMEELIARARERGIAIVMDLVMNHTSNENAWFVESSSSRDNGRADWYIWRDPAPDGSAPNNWRSIFGGSAWTWCEARQQYYLHTFADFQPDLNWANPQVRAQMIDMARFWVSKGVGGFRIDAIVYVKKPDDLADGEPDGSDGLADIHKMTAVSDGILDYLAEFRAGVCREQDGSSNGVFLVAEANGVKAQDLPLWVGDEEPFDILFEFSHVFVPYGGGLWCEPCDWRLTELKAALTASQKATARLGWYPIYFENHDQPRSPSNFFPPDADPVLAAKAMLTVLMTLRGTPFLYQGEELGYTNVAWDSIECYDDVSSRDQYARALQEGYTADEALAGVWRFSRDNARTPMQWDASENAGFSTARPWLPVHDDYVTCNVAVQDADPGSVLNWCRMLAQQRVQHPALLAGTYEELMADDEQVYAFRRQDGATCATVLVNFSLEEAAYDADLVESAQVIAASQGDPTPGVLRPLEAVVWLAS